jgi:hypothetical protein
MTAPRQYRAGQPVEDHCRQCHEDRIHTVIVVDGNAQPLRVSCDYCRSEHNYRGGPRSALAPARSAEARSAKADLSAPQEPARGARADHRESPMPQIPADSDMAQLIRRIIREESGLTPVAPAEKWRGGELVLKPGKPGVQEKAWPIESFFNKIVMVRNRLRSLEQQINASELPDDQKLKLQAYITGCYGSLTSFNVLFANDDDRFVGAGGGQ